MILKIFSSFNESSSSAGQSFPDFLVVDHWISRVFTEPNFDLYAVMRDTAVNYRRYLFCLLSDR